MIEIADKYNRQSSKRYYEQLTKLTAVKKKKQKNSSCFEVVEQEKLQEETEVMAFDTKKKNMRVDAFIAESLN
jgi:primosomal protein N''